MTKGGFHDERVSLNAFGGLTREPWTQFEISRVEQALTTFFNQDLRRAQDMTGRQQCGSERTKVAPLPISQHVLHLPARAKAGTHEAGRCIGQDRALMVACVVAMSVGDKDERSRASRIKPEITIRKKRAAVENDIHHGSSLIRIRPQRGTQPEVLGGNGASSIPRP